MEKHIDVLAGKVFYEIHNDNKDNCVVLIHGFGVNKNMWKPQIEILDDYKVIAIDARGHGKSSAFDKFCISDVCHDIKKILDAESCKCSVIAGLSMGGYTAQEFAMLYPESTNGIFIADSSPVFIKYPYWERISLKYSTPLFYLYTWKRLKKAMAKRSSVNRDVRRELENMFSKLTMKKFVSLWNGFSTVLREKDVKFDCPMTVVYGNKDITGTILLHVNDWKKHYPHCEVYKIENAGHVSNMDNPSEFNRLLKMFLEKTIKQI